MPNTRNVPERFVKTVVQKLIAANVAVFVAQLVFHEYLLAHFALWPIGRFPTDTPDLVVGFQPWQIVTSAFLHGGLAHIALNLYALWSFGRFVERALGAGQFLLLYFASIVTSGAVQLAYVTLTIDSGVVPTIGASGGVFGVLLAFAMLFPHSRVMLLIPPIPMKAWVMVIIFGLVELVTGVTGTIQGIAHFAHLGGMLGALAVMLSLRRKKHG
jgi:membrane associated rhomboid family serine protease